MARIITHLLCGAAPILLSLPHAGALSQGSLTHDLTNSLFQRADPPGQPTCPGAGGDFQSNAGDTFDLSCDTDTPGDAITQTNVPSIQACADTASTYNKNVKQNVVAAFTYVQSSKLCTLKNSNNAGAQTALTGTDSGTFVSAATPNPSQTPIPHAPSCPNSDKTFYQINGGTDIYEIQCNTALGGNDIAYTYVGDPTECMVFCTQYNTDNGAGSCMGIAFYVPYYQCHLRGPGNTVSASDNTNDAFTLRNDYPVCNGDDQFFYQGPTDGRIYTTNCGAAAVGYSTLNTVSVGSDVACANACNQNPSCIAATSSNSGANCVLEGEGSGPYGVTARDGNVAFVTNDTQTISSSSSNPVSSSSSSSSSKAASSSSSSPALSSSSSSISLAASLV